nr:Protein of unknown function DUF1759 and Integrase domain containing protein [Haemonchus contortus]
MDTKACDDLQAAPMQLAPIPIPKFSGKVWEWESFWSAFDYSVHSRKMGDIYKMNYLMESLEGEAKKSVKRFQISGSTYTMAIAHLKRKFGNPQLLLEELAKQLEGCRASTTRVEDQMTLYEEISSILNQMALKGECLDTVVLQKQVLSKFSEHLGISHTMATVRRKFWIPKLRQQVQSLTTKCVPCQRMNELPFPYPPMGPLPKRRVIRTKPFENVGIDYFGPLVAKGNDDKTKVYGIIITCMTTRMIHIEVVTDTSTDKLLLALRRFFARRGVPKTITSDNGPSFVLGDQILKDAIQSITNDDEFQAIMARKGIEWTTITPYAPWQGAFYERLIKSIKHSFYKAVGNRLLNEEELRTLLAEIEGTLNTRPLTYQGADYDLLRPLRPIDFIVKDIEITYPFESSQSDKDDPDYLPSEELFRLQTRRQAQEALASTLKATEYFWKIWHRHLSP